MSLEEIYNIDAIDDLHGYQPQEIHYAKYGSENPNLIAAGCKVEDVYQTLSRARGLLHYGHSTSWGDIAPEGDPFCILFAQSQMLLSALLLYGITLDMSWQLAWAYVQPASLDFLLGRNYIDKYKDCTLENIILQLNCSISYGGQGVTIAEQLREKLLAFKDKPEAVNLRE